MPCRFCGNPLEGSRLGGRIYCNEDCRYKAQLEKSKTRYHQGKLAALKGEVRTCGFCNKPIPVERSRRAKTCSDRCAYLRQRQRANPCVRPDPETIDLDAQQHRNQLLKEQMQEFMSRKEEGTSWTYKQGEGLVSGESDK